MPNELNAVEISALKEGGFDLEVLYGNDPFYKTARELLELFSTSMSPDATAKRLGVTTEFIQRMIVERKLYAIASPSG